MSDALPHWIIEETPSTPTQAQRDVIEECLKGFDIMHKIGKVYETIPFSGWSHIKSGRTQVKDRWRCLSEHYDFTGKSVLDLGGNYGYMAFRALAAGASKAVVIDRERTEIAAGPLFAEAYGYNNIQFIAGQAPEILDTLVEHFDCALVLSMLPYLRYQGGDAAMNRAAAWLGKNINEAVFLEAQKTGDSVGPPQWGDDEAVSTYFQGYGFQDCRVVGEGFPVAMGAKRSIMRMSAWPNPLEFSDNRSLGITEHSTVLGGDGKRVVKWVWGGQERIEFNMLRRLRGPGFPRGIEVGQKYIVMTDLGDREPITDMKSVRRSANAIVKELDSAGIKHGDIGEWNIIIKDNAMQLLDFGTARDEGDDGYQPRSGDNKGNMKKLLTLLEGQAHG